MTGLKVIDGTPTAISKYLREIEDKSYEDKLKEEIFRRMLNEFKIRREHNGRKKLWKYYSISFNKIGILRSYLEDNFQAGKSSAISDEIKFLENICNPMNSDYREVKNRIKQLKQTQNERGDAK